LNSALLNQITYKKIEAEIVPLQEKDYKVIKSGKRFRFNWNNEIQNQCFKLILKDSKQIMGLMSLIKFKKELWLKINLLESSEENIGKNKEYDRIAGCLIGYACRLAFIKGFDGCIALEPKTQLREHYINKYNMKNAGKHLFLEFKDSENVINEYL
jgi:hypothetical protein